MTNIVKQWKQQPIHNFKTFEQFYPLWSLTTAAVFTCLSFSLQKVLFYDGGAFYGAHTNINGKTFLKCTGARASSAAKFGPCLASGVTVLHEGDKVGVASVYPMKEVEMRPESTYFGMIKLN